MYCLEHEMHWETVIFSRNNKYVLVTCKLAIPFVCYSYLVYNFKTINIQTIEAAVENKIGRFPNVYTCIYTEQEKLSKKYFFLILYFQK
jgi:hypothetical protein